MSLEQDYKPYILTGPRIFFLVSTLIFNLLKMALILCGSSALRCGWNAGRRLRPPLRLLFISVFMSNTPSSRVRAIAVGDGAWLAACHERRSQSTPEPGYTSTWVIWRNIVQQHIHCLLTTEVILGHRSVGFGWERFSHTSHLSWHNSGGGALAFRAAPPQLLHVSLATNWCLLSHMTPQP